MKYLLSLSGGGVRGVLIVQFLALLERDLKWPLTTYFDFFGGTSIGSIIVAGLVYARMTASELLFYFFDPKTLAQMFPNSIMDRIFNLVQSSPKYNGKGKRDFLFQHMKQRRMRDTTKDVLIPIWDVKEKRPLTLCNWECENYLVRDVLDAASAAPGYFPVVKFEKGQKIVYGADAAIYANNPVDIVLSEALKKYGVDEDITIISICTGNSDTPMTEKQAEKSLGYGGIQWFIKEKLLDMIMDGAKDSARDTTKVFSEALGCKYVNVNGHIDEVSMDDCSDKNLKYLKETAKLWYAEYGPGLVKLLEKKNVSLN